MIRAHHFHWRITASSWQRAGVAEEAVAQTMLVFEQFLYPAEKRANRRMAAFTPELLAARTLAPTAFWEIPITWSRAGTACYRVRNSGRQDSRVGFPTHREYCPASPRL